MKIHHPYILLIDDDQDDLDLLSALLLKSGIISLSYTSGTEAQNYLRHISGLSPMPSLIIVDYNMPGTNGQQVLAALKSNSCTQDIPIIVYSTLMSVLSKNDLIKQGAYDCMAKPFKFNELADQVTRFVTLAYSSGDKLHSA